MCQNNPVEYLDGHSINPSNASEIIKDSPLCASSNWMRGRIQNVVKQQIGEGGVGECRPRKNLCLSSREQQRAQSSLANEVVCVRCKDMMLWESFNMII